MTSRIAMRKGGPITLDGRPLPGHLARVDPRDGPFRLLLWAGGDRLYDVELYCDGQYIGSVPPPSILLDAVYDQAEAHLRDHPDSPPWKERY